MGNYYDYNCKFYDLPNGKRVEEYQIPHLTDLETILYLMQQDYVYFKDLKPEFKDNPLVLKQALIGFLDFYNQFSGYCGSNLINPIFYAGKNALTKENISLGLSAEKSKISYDSDALTNPLIVLALYELGNNIDFRRLPSSVRNNPLVLKQALLKLDESIELDNPISYAEKDALTEDNIKLALKKNNPIKFIDGYPLINSELFHRINIEEGTIRVEYKNLPNSIKNDDNLMLSYISGYPDYYKDLNESQRDNPEILKQALLNYDKTFRFKLNPISYSNEHALTEENIRLALEIGHIIFIENKPLSKNELFHRINIEEGKFAINYASLPDSIKNNDELMLMAVSRTPNYFIDLNNRQKNNPEFLSKALNSYDSNMLFSNPISYALKDALTTENIELALEKGKIEIFLNSDLSNNKYFILECLKRKLYTRYYNNISDNLKNDPEIRQLLLLNTPVNIQSKPIDMDHSWSPKGFTKTYKYYQAIVGILPDGEFKEEEVRGNSKRSFSHYQGVSNVINDFENEYPDNLTIKELQEELQKLEDNPFFKAVKCSEYGILTVLIEGENSQIYFPKNISKEQFDVLSTMLSNDLKDLNFRFLYDEEEYYEYIEPETHNSRDLKSDDVIGFIHQNKIFVPADNTYNSNEENPSPKSI